MYPKDVVIKEVGPRDGLQNEQTFVPTETKIAWIHQLSDSRLQDIELTSFVHPKWIPALKDAEAVVQGIKKKEGVHYSALVPNVKGLERALTFDVLDGVNVFMSATESHNQKNINKSIAATFPVMKETIMEAKRAGKTVRAYVSTAFFCPHEGRTNPEKVVEISDTLLDYGADEISIGDTIGVASPLQVRETVTRLVERLPKEKLAMHFHDTRGMALANIVTALELGITTFDSACGGLGGCPYAAGASGNVATEDVLYMLDQMGIQTNVSIEKVVYAAQWMEKTLNKKLSSKALDVYTRQSEKERQKEDVNGK